MIYQEHVKIGTLITYPALAGERNPCVIIDFIDYRHFTPKYFTVPPKLFNHPFDKNVGFVEFLYWKAHWDFTPDEFGQPHDLNILSIDTFGRLLCAQNEADFQDCMDQYNASVEHYKGQLEIQRNYLIAHYPDIIELNNVDVLKKLTILSIMDHSTVMEPLDENFDTYATNSAAQARAFKKGAIAYIAGISLDEVPLALASDIHDLKDFAFFDQSLILFILHLRWRNLDLFQIRRCVEIDRDNSRYLLKVLLTRAVAGLDAMIAGVMSRMMSTERFFNLESEFTFPGFQHTTSIAFPTIDI